MSREYDPAFVHIGERLKHEVPVVNYVVESYFAKSRSVFLNLFRAVAHFKGPQILAADYHKNFDVTIAMSLG